MEPFDWVLIASGYVNTKVCPWCFGSCRDIEIDVMDETPIAVPVTCRRFIGGRVDGF